MAKQTNDITWNLITSLKKVNGREDSQLQGLTKIDAGKWLIWSLFLNHEHALDKEKYSTNEIRLQRLLSLETVSHEDESVHEIEVENPEDFPEFLSDLKNEVRTILYDNNMQLPYGVFGDGTTITEEFQKKLKTLPEDSTLDLTLSTEVNGKKIYSYTPADFIKDAQDILQVVGPYIRVVLQVNRENGDVISFDFKNKQLKVLGMSVEEYIAVVYAAFKK